MELVEHRVDLVVFVYIDIYSFLGVELWSQQQVVGCSHADAQNGRQSQ